ncbi:MAG: hypothetical protein ACI8PT_003332, partial [Gammaproteobacteria bacterium]
MVSTHCGKSGSSLAWIASSLAALPEVLSFSRHRVITPKRDRHWNRYASLSVSAFVDNG